MFDACLFQVGRPTSMEVDVVIGADGANSRVAKDIGAGDYEYAIAFQVISTEKHLNGFFFWGFIYSIRPRSEQVTTSSTHSD